jgi:phosphate transport system ATP-binding protein
LEQTVPEKIVIKNFNFFYQTSQALRDVNLKIYENEIFGLFGPANSGTTTLLRALNRLCDLTPEIRIEGRILLDGQDIRSEELAVTDLRRRVGMVFEEPVPLPMSIFDNIAYGPRMRGMKNKAQLEERVEEALRLAVLWEEVKDRLKSPALRLSGGQQQRLCIARILSLQPEVILLDRPCAALDPISTAKIEDSLLELKKRFTIVLIPHNIQQAVRIADRAAFMLMGEMVETGLNQQIFTNPSDERTGDYVTGRFG